MGDNSPEVQVTPFSLSHYIFLQCGIIVGCC